MAGRQPPMRWSVTSSCPGMPGTTLNPGECTALLCKRWGAPWPRNGLPFRVLHPVVCHVRWTAMRATETLAERVICVVWASAGARQRSVAWKQEKGTWLAWGEGRETLQRLLSRSPPVWAGPEWKGEGTQEEAMERKRRKGPIAFSASLCPPGPWQPLGACHSGPGEVSLLQVSWSLAPWFPPPGLGSPSLSLFHPLLQPRNLPGPEASRTKPRTQAGNPSVFSHLTRVSINLVPAPANPRTEGKKAG